MERTMENVFEQLKAYLATATQEQLDADWEKLKKYNEIGPEMLSLLDGFVIEYQRTNNKEISIADFDGVYNDEQYLDLAA